MIRIKTLAYVMSVVALSACGGDNDATQTTPDSTTPDSTAPEMSLLEKAVVEHAKLEAAATASEAARMAAEMALEAAEKYDDMFGAVVVQGSSMMARANAQKVLDARDNAKMAVAAAEAALVTAEAAQTELNTLKKEAGMIEDPAAKTLRLTAIDLFLTRVGVVIATAQDDIDAAEAIHKGEKLTNALVKVEGDDDMPMDADDHAMLVVDAVEGALAIMLAPAGVTTSDGLFAKGDNHQGMMFANIIKANPDFEFSEQPLADAIVPAVLIDDGEPAGGLTNWEKDDLTGQIYTWHGFLGKAFCRGDDCAVADNELTGSFYFSPDLEEAYYVENADSPGVYVLELYAEYGTWLTAPEDGAVVGLNRYAAVAESTAVSGTPNISTASEVLVGSATYAGDAGGLSVHKEFDSDSMVTSRVSGAFTADVSLTATFGAAADAMLSGEVSNFAGDAVDPKWNIKLVETALVAATTGTIEDDDDGAWTAVPYGPATDARPSGFFGGFNARFSDGHAAGAYVAARQ